MKTSRGLFVLCLSLCAVAISLAQNDIIFMKDGFSITGTVQKQYVEHVDPSGTLVPITKFGATFQIDDGVRRIKFPPRLISEALRLPPEKTSEPIRFNFNWINLQRFTGVSHDLGQYVITNRKPFNNEGERVIEVKSAGNPKIFGVNEVVRNVSNQRIELITRKYSETAFYLPTEFPASEVIGWIRAQLKKQKKEDVQEQLQIVRLCISNGWMSEAEAELARIKKEFPNATDLIVETNSTLQRATTQQRLEEIEDAVKASQHDRVQQLLKAADSEFADATVLSRLAQLRREYKTKSTELERARKLFSTAMQDAAETGFVTQTKPFLEELEKSINLDTLPRLNVFLKLAAQEERLKDQNQPSTVKPEELLAYAISGWLVGPNAAEGSVEVATKWVLGREFLRKFLVEDSETIRENLLTQYEKGQPLNVTEMQQLLKELDPIIVPTIKPNTPLLLKTPPSDRWENGVNYHVYLPPEYHPHKAWPVLLVAPNWDTPPEIAVQSWLSAAMKKGMIVVVPEWVSPGQSGYNGTDKEREAVLLTLRDVRKYCHMDAGRVTLAGFSGGGSLAMDLGLTRPDLFAGIISICGYAPETTEAIKTNAQYLPFYIVDGDKSIYREKKGPLKKDQMGIYFDFWVPKGYPCLLVDYKGRGFEPFLAEVPRAVDWAVRKQRAKAWPNLGKPDNTGGRNGQELRSVQASNKRMYWVTGDGGNPTTSRPVTITASWDAPNTMRAEIYGWKNVRVWLNSSMVDFSNPVELKLYIANGAAPVVWKGSLKPSLKILLEDFYQRGDAIEPYTQFVDIR